MIYLIGNTLQFNLDITKFDIISSSLIQYLKNVTRYNIINYVNIDTNIEY